MNKPSEPSNAETVAERTDKNGVNRQLLRVPEVKYSYVLRGDVPDYAERTFSSYSAEAAIHAFLEEDE